VQSYESYNQQPACPQITLGKFGDDAATRQVSTGCTQQPGLVSSHHRRLVQKPDLSSACIKSLHKTKSFVKSFWSLDVAQKLYNQKTELVVSGKILFFEMRNQ
jgi:hypothetical protein